MYEAFFCCSMRIAEGLKSLSESCFLRRDKLITLALFDDCKIIYDDGSSLSVTKQGEVSDGTFSLAVSANLAEGCSARIYLPPYARVRCNGVFAEEWGFLTISKSGDYMLEFTLCPSREGIAYFLGDILLTHKKRGDNTLYRFVVDEDGRKFTPITDCMRLADEEAVQNLVQEL